MLNYKSFSLYSLLTIATLSWWFAAFHTSPKIYSSNSSTLISYTLLCPEKQCISTLDRKELHQALIGDYTLMTQLMSTWDFDAQILQSHGIDGIIRLPPEKLLRVLELGRKLQNGMFENSGSIHLKFLPQTYVSASFLMALVPPAQIVAIPKGLRTMTQIYPKALMELIPLDIDRFHTEILFNAHPDIAFVSNYSDPSTVQTLNDQGIHLVYLENVGTLEEIQHSLLLTGRTAQVPEKAEVLALFMDAALSTIDNRLKLMTAKSSKRNVLCLDYFDKLALPTQITLKGKLLKRLGINISIETNSDAWSIPFTREELLSNNPDILIFSSLNEHLGQQILFDPALAQVDAIRNGQFYFLDEALQNSPSQYLVLAYYDLFKILEGQ